MFMHLYFKTSHNYLTTNTVAHRQHIKLRIYMVDISRLNISHKYQRMSREYEVSGGRPPLSVITYTESHK